MQGSASRARVSLRRLGGFALLLVLASPACTEHPGQVRASDKDLVGTYATTFDTGTELLQLRSDGTYIQVFYAPARQFSNRGTWESRMFLASVYNVATVVELQNANLSEDEPPGSPFRYGGRNLVVHRSGGKLQLAKNEAADWYYERVD